MDCVYRSMFAFCYRFQMSPPAVERICPSQPARMLSCLLPHKGSKIDPSLKDIIKHL